MRRNVSYIAVAERLDWTPCPEEGCIGVAAGREHRCFAHTSPEERQRLLGGLRRAGAADFVRGVAFTRALLDELLAGTRAPDGSVRLHSGDFRRATFADAAAFGAAGATFEDRVSFAGATFEGGADFLEATFAGPADFTEASFKRDAQFGAFNDMARFTGSVFDENGWFTTFRADARFDGVTFGGSAVFREASVEGDASFLGARFNGAASFEWAEFGRTISFRGARFEQTRDLGALLVLDLIDFDDAFFLQPVDLKVSANRLTAVKARFADGVNLQVRWAEIALEQAEFGSPSLLAGAEPFAAVFDPRHYRAATGLGSGFARSKRLDETRLTEQWRDDPTRSERPCLLSLRRSDVGRLALANVDLRACRFDGALNLSGLRTEHGEVFARTPATYPGFRRQAIAEEHELRKRRGGPLAPGWLPPECQLPVWLGTSRQLEPYEVAAIYRDLRKGREDRRDEPGAADFYYGEMEMRRLDRSGSVAERAIIWLYWLFSGYGLRASRAVIALVVTVIAFGAFMYWWGFPRPVSFADALTFAAQSTTALFRPPQRELTLAGTWLTIALRLLGPLFFGLALLSLRGRVKR
jgi:hypothetical protein